MRGVFLFFFCVPFFGSVWTLRSYVMTSGDRITLQDIVVETLPTNMVLDGKVSTYSAKDVGVLLRRLSFKDFIIVGERVVIFRGVRLVSPEEWYQGLSVRYPSWKFQERELPHAFEVISEELKGETLELTCRVYMPHRYDELRFFVPGKKGGEEASSKTVFYRFERTREQEGFLSYISGAVVIRIPVKILPHSQSDMVLVENRINHRVLRLKRSYIEGL